MTEKQKQEAALADTPRVVELPWWTMMFVALAPMALMLFAVAFFSWAMHHSLTSERSAHVRAEEASTSLGECRLEKAELRGRVHSYEGVLVRPHSAALEAAVREYLGIVGGGDEADRHSLDRFATWLRAEKRR